VRITVELQVHLKQYSPNGAAVFEVEVPQGTTVDSIVNGLGIPEEMASVIVVNREKGEPETVLREGDKLTLIPPLAGG